MAHILQTMKIWLFHVVGFFRERQRNIPNNNNNTLFTHATSRSNKNLLKHVREIKSIEN